MVVGFVEDVAEPVAAFFAVHWDVAVGEVLGGCVPDMGYLKVVQAEVGTAWVGLGSPLAVGGGGWFVFHVVYYSIFSGAQSNRTYGAFGFL